MQETNLNYEMTVIKLCDMLRNVYGIMLLRKLCELCNYEKHEINILLRNKVPSKKFQKQDLK